MKFVDEAEIIVASGNGGPGSVSFRREAMVARGGPDGGNGGKGGDLILRVDTRMSSLLDFSYKKAFRAQHGEQGKGANRSGSDGDDLVIHVPPGTLIKTSSGEVLKDMGESGEFVFLKGGIGGKGNTFYKTSVNQAPGVAQKGMPGEERTIRLELKLLADVGLIGMPNAGKSTLISVISAARPKIADYPFTTLIPQLGVVKGPDDQNFVIADIPGLIEGAAQGSGLGTDFLRHIERTRILVHLIDVSPTAAEEPTKAYEIILKELKEHDESQNLKQGYARLSDRPQMVVLNKIDVLSEDDLRVLSKKFQNQYGIEPLAISAVTRKNLKNFVDLLSRSVKGNE